MSFSRKGTALLPVPRDRAGSAGPGALTAATAGQTGAPVPSGSRAVRCQSAKNTKMEGSRLCPSSLHPTSRSPRVLESRGWREPPTGTGAPGPRHAFLPRNACRENSSPPLVSSVFIADHPHFLAMTACDQEQKPWLRGVAAQRRGGPTPSLLLSLSLSL